MANLEGKKKSKAPDSTPVGSTVKNALIANTKGQDPVVPWLMSTMAGKYPMFATMQLYAQNPIVKEYMKHYESFLTGQGADLASQGADFFANSFSSLQQASPREQSRSSKAKLWAQNKGANYGLGLWNWYAGGLPVDYRQVLPFAKQFQAYAQGTPIKGAYPLGENATLAPQLLKSFGVDSPMADTAAQSVGHGLDLQLRENRTGGVKDQIWKTVNDTTRWAMKKHVLPEALGEDRRNPMAAMGGNVAELMLSNPAMMKQMFQMAQQLSPQDRKLLFKKVKDWWYDQDENAGKFENAGRYYGQKFGHMAGVGVGTLMPWQLKVPIGAYAGHEMLDSPLAGVMASPLLAPMFVTKQFGKAGRKGLGAVGRGVDKSIEFVQDNYEASPVQRVKGAMGAQKAVRKMPLPSVIRKVVDPLAMVTGYAMPTLTSDYSKSPAPKFKPPTGDENE